MLFRSITPDIEVHQSKIEELEQGGRLHEADLKGALPNPTDPAKPNVPAAGAPGQPSSSATPPAGKADAKADAKADTKAPPADTTTADANAPKTPPVDYQLARAVDLLHGVAMFNTHAVN